MARKERLKGGGDAEIDMTPMLDIVFIMLIFFIVTTSFVKETGVQVNKPEAETARQLAHGNILIGVTENGTIWMAKNQVELNDVRAKVEQMHAENPEGSAVIIADKKAPSGLVIKVMDQVQLAGVSNISIAAEEGTNGS
ncbi:MAG: biopolymer transporter ExbD [Gammaproteobacteria bacterium]|jgi:biopolymer transport protein ExbD